MKWPWKFWLCSSKTVVAMTLSLAIVLTGASVSAQVLAPVGLLTVDRSASMDCGASADPCVVPTIPGVCAPDIESYARTRYILAMEGMTGSWVDYCPMAEARPASPDGRDVGIPYDHTVPDPASGEQLANGFLDQQSANVNFAFFTFDAGDGPLDTFDDDYSWPGRTHPLLDFGIASQTDPVGGFVRALPEDGYPSVPGSVIAHRLATNAEIQQRIVDLVPAGATPLASSFYDVQLFRHTDDSFLNDPHNACRPVVHVLITDGAPSFDICHGGSVPPELALVCSRYTTRYETTLTQTQNMTDGVCPQCPMGETVYEIPTYVVAFNSDDVDIADDIAQAGDTCALLDAYDNCLERAFRADDQAELIFSLGIILNHQRFGVVSYSPSLTTYVTGEDGAGSVRYSVSTEISRTSPYWEGRMTRQLYTCQEPEEDAPLELLLDSEIAVHELLTPDFVTTRNVMTARLDYARSGVSCDNPLCVIGTPRNPLNIGAGQYTCYQAGAITAPEDGTATDYGDATGGVDSGGAHDVDPVGIDGGGFVTTTDALTLADVTTNRWAEREGIPLRSNDNELPDNPQSIDFDLLDSDGDCLIPVNEATFVPGGGAPDLREYLYADSETEAKRIVHFVRGHDLEWLNANGLLTGFMDPTTIGLRDRSGTGYAPDWSHNRMALLGRPSPVFSTSPGYLNFVQTYGTRPYTLFIGGLGLHAFDAITGVEQYVIIPPSFLPQLGDTLWGPRTLAGGAVVVRDLVVDVVSGEAVYGTVAVVTYHDGGSGFMAVRVDNPLQPRFLYEITAQQFPELGLSFPTPLVTNVFINGQVEPVIIFNGGPPLTGRNMGIGGVEVGSHEGEMVAIVHALTGETYKQWDPLSDPDLFAQCGSATGSIGSSGHDVSTTFAFGSERGCLIRGDLTDDDPTNWTLNILHQTEQEGAFHFEPAIAPHEDGTFTYILGHGMVSDIENTNVVGNLVSVTEPIVSEYVGETLVGYSLDTPVVNWEIELEIGEVITTPPLIIDGVVYVASRLPDELDACADGSARLYGIDWIGDPETTGDDPSYPHRVDIDSDRIVARLDNPVPNDGEPDYEPYLKYLGSEYLGGNSVVYSLAVEAVPTCDTYLAYVEGEPVAMDSGATTRQLRVEVVQFGTEEAAPDGDDPWHVEAASSFSVVNFTVELSQDAMVAIPLDWSIVRDF